MANKSRTARTAVKPFPETTRLMQMSGERWVEYRCEVQINYGGETRSHIVEKTTTTLAHCEENCMATTLLDAIIVHDFPLAIRGGKEILWDWEQHHKFIDVKHDRFTYRDDRGPHTTPCLFTYSERFSGY